MRFRASDLMDEIWEKAVESALDGQTDHSSVQTLTLDGAVKCVHGRLPPPAILEKFDNLHHLSIANIGVSSLEQFPALKNLQKLNLSDNRIAGGLNHLVEAGLESLRDLDLSNNRIQFIDDLAPLAQLRLLSLDLYESPVTRVKNYRARVFGLIKSLRFLDKMDVEGVERPESDDDDEDEEEDDDDGEEEEDEEDPGSGEIDGDSVDRPGGIVNGGHIFVDRDGVVDVDEDEESDADEEESEIVRNGSVVPDLHNQSNGFHVQAVNNDAGVEEDEGDDDEDGEYEDDNDSGEEIDEDGVDADVVEVHEILDSDDEEEDGVDEDDDDEGSDEDVDNEEVNMVAAPYANGRLANAEGVIDGHEHGEDDEEDGEEEEEGVEDERDFDDDEEEEDGGAGYLVQPVGQVVEDATASDMDPVNDDEDDLEEEEIQDDDHHGRVELQGPSSSSHLKRKRDFDADCDDEEDGSDDDSDDDDDDGGDDDDDGEDDTI